MAASTDSTPIDVDVLIIGGGGCGLTLSSLLSEQGVDHIVFERHAGTSKLPKAHYLNQRSMEILRQYGMSEPVIEKSGTMRFISRVQWSSSLGGDGPYDRKILGTVDAFGGGEDSDQAIMYQRDSPLRSHNLPQIRLEPVLREMAEKRNPGRVLFNHNVTSIEATDDYILVNVLTDEEKELRYRAKYLVGADGGKTVGPHIGVEMQGPTGIVDIVSTHFKADLSPYWDDRNFIAHFSNPGGGSMLGSGSLVPMGPTWGRFSEEWTLHFGFDLNDESRWDEARLMPRIRELLKLPDLQMEVLNINHWVLERVLASKYQQGRIFIAGDAAHRHPPTTGLGLNTAIGDAHNLAWKLALVLKGQAHPRLLDTYEVERRPIGKRNCDWGLMTFMNTAVLNAAIGLIPGQPEMNQARFEALFEESDVGATLRATVQDAIRSQKIEFSAHDLELGYSYSDGALLSDGTPRPTPDPLGQVYTPTTRPGHRLPHAWLRVNDDKNHNLISTHDLVGKGADFLLLTDSKGSAWGSAAQHVSQRFGVTVNIATVDTQPIHGKDIMYIDHNSTWASLNQLQPGGAILVRPDNMVAWRSSRPSDDGARDLAKAMGAILKDVEECRDGEKNGLDVKSTQFHIVRGNIKF
ncbi:FAD binding domain-containing protein [Ilyonectria sp. MPI-CAGE-AT-0026]|nr:FAD binding domain-containing protein [Ilyonectria sp. MPI-CAGE-AT-0026]